LEERIMSLIETRRSEGTSAVALSDFRAVSENREVEVLRGLVQQGVLKTAIRRIYDYADGAIQARRTADLAELVMGLESSIGDSLEFAIAVLTATLPAKAELTVRKHYASKLIAELEVRGHEASSVLRGLL
jgi:hypothetical protein